MGWTVRGSTPGRDKRLCFSPETSKMVLAPIQPLIRQVPVLHSPEVKQTGRKADHSTPSTSEVKNEWTYTSIPPTCLHGVDKERKVYVYVLQINTQC